MCVTSLLCGPPADLWPFYGFLCKRFSLIRLFRERLSEKVHGTIPKGILGGFEFTVSSMSSKFERMTREAIDSITSDCEGD